MQKFFFKFIFRFVHNKCYGCVAQLVEQLTLNQWVWGSNPHAPTNKKRGLLKEASFFIGIGNVGFEAQKVFLARKAFIKA